MKAIKRISIIAGLALFLGVFFLQTDTSAQQYKGNGAGLHFVDLNGDGINDNALDADGDGVPNCLDADYVRPMDGSGNQMGKGKAGKFGKGGYGPGNGTGNQGIGPKDGTGFGAANGTGTGVCDGTGPKGSSLRGGRQ